MKIIISGRILSLKKEGDVYKFKRSGISSFGDDDYDMREYFGFSLNNHANGGLFKHAHAALSILRDVYPVLFLY